MAELRCGCGETFKDEKKLKEHAEEYHGKK